LSEAWLSEPLERLVEPDSPITYGVVKPGDPGAVPFVRGGDIADGRVLVDQLRTISAEVSRQYRRTLLQGGELLISLVGQPGQVAVAPPELAGSNIARQVGLIRLSWRVLPSFVSYFLRSPDGVTGLGARTGGSVQQVINLSDLRQVLVPVPERVAQQRLVDLLDEAFEGIATAKANAEKNLQNARELFDSRLRCLVSEQAEGSDRKTLREIAMDFGRGKSKHRPRNDPKLYGGPYPFIQTGDVRASDHLITDFSQTYSDAGLAQSKLWPKGTLCITIAANIAETGVLGFAACFPDSVIGVVVDERQTSGKYLEYMLQTVKSELKAKGKGSAQDNINLATFENERFPFPDLSTQANILGLLDALAAEIQRLEATYADKLAALNELKRSLLHQAFNGNL
jgi:type I restriction enzyme, S subunit